MCAERASLKKDNVLTDCWESLAPSCSKWRRWIQDAIKNLRSMHWKAPVEMMGRIPPHKLPVPEAGFCPICGTVYISQNGPHQPHRNCQNWILNTMGQRVFGYVD